MKKLFVIVTLALSACALMGEVKVEKTMTVARCQAILKDGTQCRYQAESGQTYCWRHRGLVKKAKSTWTNATAKADSTWERTKKGANEAWTATCDAFSEAGEEFVKLFKGKTQKSEKKTK